MVRDIEDDGVLIFDDTIQEKPYTDENELISWHFDHSKACPVLRHGNRTVKGINPGSKPAPYLIRGPGQALLNCVYHAQGVTLPVACELILRQAQEQTPRLSRCQNGSPEAKEHLFQE